jgi:hypothetical protein
MRPRVWALALVGSMLMGCVGGSGEVTQQDKQRLKAYILDQAPTTMPRKLDIDFDGKVTLLGCRVEPRGPVEPGQRVRLTMYWKSKEALGDGWNLFTHVLDGSGERILNIDNVGPLREWRQTRQVLWPSAWQPGKVYVDEQQFSIPSNVRTKRVQIVTGIWKGNTRLKIRAGRRDRENRAIVVDLDVKAGAKSPKKRSSRVPKMRVSRLEAGTKLVIDGQLDEDAWKTAAKTGPFVNASTGDVNRSQELGGSAQLLWDQAALYVGFDVRDTKVVGDFPPNSKDPHLWTKDTVEIMVDPDGDGDNRDYYEIQINPQNLVFDSRFDRYNQPKQEPDGPFGHQDWSARLESAVKVRGTINDDGDQDQGYVVEARIPWSAFDRAKHAPPRTGDTWRMNFYVMQNNGGYAWSPILKQGNFHKASRFGRVQWAEKDRARGYPGGRQPPRGTKAKGPGKPRERGQAPAPAASR